jgi:hypothetical protein
MQGDFMAAQTRLQQSLDLAQRVGDRLEEAIATQLMGNVVRDRGDASQADRWYERALSIERQIGKAFWQGSTLARLARTALHEGRAADAVELANTARTLLREHNYTWGLATSLQTLSAAALARRDDVTVRQLLEEELALLHDLGHQQGLTISLLIAGRLAHVQRAPNRAATFYLDGLELAQAAGDRPFMLRYLEAVAALVAERRPAQAVRLVSAAAAERERLGAPALDDEREQLEADMQPARERLESSQFTASWADGQRLPLEEAIGEARHLLEVLQRVTPER